jgi:VCBS repeat-containing protein
VTLTSVGSYSGSVSLTVNGVPKGTTANFSPNPVALPAGAVRTAQLTITTTNSTPQYLMNLTVTGSDGTRSHSQIVSLNPQ